MALSCGRGQRVLRVCGVGGQLPSAGVSRGGSAQPDLRVLLNLPLKTSRVPQDVVQLPSRRPGTRSTNWPSDHRLVTSGETDSGHAAIGQRSRQGTLFIKKDMQKEVCREGWASPGR